jgi:hypothetical protein
MNQTTICTPVCGGAAPACTLNWFASPCVCTIPPTTTQSQPQSQPAPQPATGG